jgi:NTP pyrophosphatase (non-canonical NTP hydrolase)
MTNAELERLAILSEELGEVQQVIGKILRHGYENYHPNDKSRTSNRQLLEAELGDVGFAVKLLIESDDLSESRIYKAFDEKAEKIEQYLHFNKRNHP